jgi:RND family efflux transporter MFP subunit
MMKIAVVTGTLLLLLAIGGCSKHDSDAADRAQPPWVKTVAVQPDVPAVLRVSGTIRARYEIPMAFQVGGRILAREVDAGQRVQAGQRLFRLDPRDFDEAVRAAEAQLAAAAAALEMETKSLQRRRQLKEDEAVSQEDLERAELAVRDAVSRRDVALANLAQAKNARNYAELRVKQAGVVIEVMGEPGQVVGTGQAVAVLALEGEREIEVFLADGSRPPRAGTVHLANGTTGPLVLREIAGAADPVSRTWRARYRVQGAKTDVPLGTVVHVALTGDEAEADALQVPVGALDERGEGPHVWLVQDGHVQPVPVEVVKLDLEQAHIRATLPAEARIVAFGAHLLRPGMAVRERAP